MSAPKYSVESVTIRGRRLHVIVKDSTGEIVRGSFVDLAQAIQVCEALNDR